MIDVDVHVFWCSKVTVNLLRHVCISYNVFKLFRELLNQYIIYTVLKFYWYYIWYFLIEQIDICIKYIEEFLKMKKMKKEHSYPHVPWNTLWWGSTEQIVVMENKQLHLNCFLSGQNYYLIYSTGHVTRMGGGGCKGWKNCGRAGGQAKLTSNEG